MLKTESLDERHACLDEYASERLVAALVENQRTAAEAVQDAVAALAQAVEAALLRVRAGGRLVYAGAGTSGRLGLLDSVELYPTFSWPPERSLALLAGGPEAVHRAVEGAEDSRPQGVADARGIDIQRNDVLLAIAASGTTPYVLGTIDAAREVGALVIGIVNNPDTPIATAADIAVVLDTGAEIISGSTRLKAGTAQKMALNAFSSALMVRLNKVYGNLMVDLKATNAKLVRRAVRLTMLATGCDETRATAMLRQCDYRVKTAIVAIQGQVDPALADAALHMVHGNVRAALAHLKADCRDKIAS